MGIVRMQGGGEKKALSTFSSAPNQNAGGGVSQRNINEEKTSYLKMRDGQTWPLEQGSVSRMQRNEWLVSVVLW